MIKEKTALYRWFDKDENLLYVGVTLNVPNRLYQHGCANVPWFKLIASCKVEHFDDPKSALEYEKMAIKNEKPAHNVHHSEIEKKRLRLDSHKPRSAGIDTKRAERHFKKYPETTAVDLARKFKIALTTVHRSPWWINRKQTGAQQ